MEIKTRFSIGDQIYLVRIENEQLYSDCPTCNATGKAKLVKGNGTSEDIYCKDCTSGKRRAGMRGRWMRKPNKLTVGQVQVTVEKNGKREERYMCEETGLGSGSLYYSHEIFASEWDADKYVQMMNSNRDTYRYEKDCPEC